MWFRNLRCAASSPKDYIRLHKLALVSQRILAFGALLVSGFLTVSTSAQTAHLQPSPTVIIICLDGLGGIAPGLNGTIFIAAVLGREHVVCGAAARV